MASEPRLKALCLRLTDRALADTAWLESLGSLVAQLPPSRWQDHDEDTFHRELDVLIERFRHLETIAFAKKPVGDWAQGYRLGLTKLDGHETQEVVFVGKDEIEEVDAMAGQIRTILEKNRRLGIAALAQLMWEKPKKK